MASVLDDLRYLSRYGYQDPWAEAVKNISNNLLSLADTKMRRDMLVAEYRDKKQARADTLSNRDTQNIIDIYRATADEDKHFILPKLEEVLSGTEGGPEFFQGLSDASKARQSYRTEFDTLSGTTGNIREDYNNALQLSEMAKGKDVAVANNKLRIRSMLLEKDNRKNTLREFVVRNSPDGGTGYISDVNASTIMGYIDEDNLEGASQLLLDNIKRSADKLKVIDDYHSTLMTHAAAQKEEFGVGYQAGHPEYDARMLLEKSRVSMRQDFPDKYKLPNMSFPDALYRWKIGTAPSQEKPVDNGTKPPPPEEQTVYKPILNIPFQDVSLPNDSQVRLTNPVTGKPYDKVFDGKTAKQMMAANRGNLIKDGTSFIKFTWGDRDDRIGYRGMVYEKPVHEKGFTPFRKPPGWEPREPELYKPRTGEKETWRERMFGGHAHIRNERATLQSGDEVMNMKTGKRYPVIIQSPTGTRPDEVTADKITYIVNGAKYNWTEFMKLFGKPLFDKSTVITSPRGRTLQDRVTRAAANSFIVNSVTKVDSDSSWVSDSTNWMQPAK
jgi:hypothetical protein